MIDRFPSPKLAAAGVLLVLVVLALYAGIIAASALGGHAAGRLLLRDLAPVVFYLYAIGVAGVTIRRIGAGRALHDLVSPMLRRIGWALFAGGIAQVFAVPLLLRTGEGSFATFDVSAMTVGAIGVTLVIVARLVRDAERNRAELDEIV